MKKEKFILETENLITIKFFGNFPRSLNDLDSEE